MNGQSPAESTEASPGDASPEIILASASAARAGLLSRAGVVTRRQAGRIDETDIIASLRAEGAEPTQVAETLAELKARRISRQAGGSLVIGADQLLESDGAWFDKPAGRPQAAADLRA